MPTLITLPVVLVIGLLSAARPDQATPDWRDAINAAARCETENTWADNTPDGWVPMCGNDSGSETLAPNSCQEFANLRYAMAEGAGLDADDAYETALADCAHAAGRRLARYSAGH